MLKKLFSYLACALIVVLSFLSCKKDEPNQAVALFGGTEWRAKEDLTTAVNKDTHYYVCRFNNDGTFRLSRADQGGMVFAEVASGTYTYEEPYMMLHTTGSGYVFGYSTSPEEHFYAEYFGLNFYRQ